MIESTLVLEGYEARIYVERGHLVISDGFPAEGKRREIRFPRGRCEVTRIIVRAPGGTISIPAFDWCSRMGIALAFIASDSTLTNCLLPNKPHDAPLRRAQAFCGVSDEAVPLARSLLGAKIHSEISAVTHDFAKLGIGNEKARKAAASELQTCPKGIERDTTLTQFLVREGYAARVYWELLGGTPLPWPNWCLKRIPGHWAFINPRFSGGRSRVRDAHDPFNAVLNYVYTLLEVETRLACAGAGLDPDFGLLHVDDRLRESFVFDLLEPLRAKADIWTLELLRKEMLRPSMFHELRDGIVRLDPDLAKLLAVVLMPRFAKASLQAANEYAKHLRRIRVPYRLVRVERSSIAGAPSEVLRTLCEYCKQPLPRKGLKFCARDCYLRYSVEVARPIDKAQAKLAEMRAAGLSPGHGGEAAKKRGAKIAESNRRRALGLTPAEMRARRARQMRGYRVKKKN